MPENTRRTGEMPRNTDETHHQPRKIDKKKKHRRGFSEDVQDNRHSRISFKRYLQEVEEMEVDDEVVDELNDAQGEEE
jgi:hypothetical protein